MFVTKTEFIEKSTLTTQNVKNLINQQEIRTRQIDKIFNEVKIINESLNKKLDGNALDTIKQYLDSVPTIK